MNDQANIRAMLDAAETFPASDAPGGGFLPPDPEAPPIESECATYPLNDYGNGLRFLAYFGEDCLFAPRVGWHRWTGQVWRLDEDKLEVRGLAHGVGAKIVEEVEFIALEDWEREAIRFADDTREELDALLAKKTSELEPEERLRKKALSDIKSTADAARGSLGGRKKSHRSHAQRSGNSGAINNMLQEASVSVAVPVTALNVDPLLVNTPSGVIRFHKLKDEHAAAWPGASGETMAKWTFDVLPHCRDLLLSKMTSTGFDPEAECPTFMRFLQRIQPKADHRDFLQRWFGYTLTGLTTEQKLLFAHGGGRNGKSTLVDVIAEIMADYATTVPIESLTGAEQRKGSDATPDLVRIPGARMVRASEPEQGQRMREAIIKALTGGEPILIRRMQQEFVEVTPEFKLTISGNHKPDIRGDDDGIWRRVMLLPFEEQIPEDEVDPLLPQKLRAEMSGILNWMIAGAVAWLETGLQVPKEIKEATREYREASNPVRTFLLTMCEITGKETDELPGSKLAMAFECWARENEGEEWKSHTIRRRISQAAGEVKNPETGATFHAFKKSITHYRGIAFTVDMAIMLMKYEDRRDGYS